MDLLKGAFDKLVRDDFVEKMRFHGETRETEERARDWEAERIRIEEAERGSQREEQSECEVDEKSEPEVRG